MLSEIIQKRIELPLSVLINKYDPEHVYFVLYLNLLTKFLFTEKGTYNPYGLDFDMINDAQIDDLVYIIRIFDGFTEIGGEEGGSLEHLYEAILHHYTNVGTLTVDKTFWLQRIFYLVAFITNYTHFKLCESLQVIYLIIGIKSYQEWTTDRHVMMQAIDYFDYIVTKLPKLKFGEFY